MSSTTSVTRPERHTLVLDQPYTRITDEHTVTVVAHHQAPTRSGDSVTLYLVTLACCACGEPVDTSNPDSYTVHRVRGDSKYGYEPMHAHTCEECGKCGDTAKGLAAHMHVKHGPRLFSRPDYVLGRAWR